MSENEVGDGMLEVFKWRGEQVERFYGKYVKAR